jgi:hypothetical protein
MIQALFSSNGMARMKSSLDILSRFLDLPRRPVGRCPCHAVWGGEPSAEVSERGDPPLPAHLRCAAEVLEEPAMDHPGGPSGNVEV